ncbi:MAG TPA: copper resistance protein CopC [Hyphomonadaceae bacterium]|nr:copper resistance protein CopC [Hyphomonadaceae bacterium]
MNAKTLSLAAVLALLPASAMPAFAHTKVAKTSIENESTLATAPDKFSFTLEHEATLASVALVDAKGKDVALNYTPPKAAATDFTVPLPKLANGFYMLTFKTLAKDGHAMSSMVHFTVKAS